MPIREPAVAGMFYKATPTALKEQIETCFTSPGSPGVLPTVNQDGPRNILGLVCPHAGYMYSGPAAASSYYHLAEDGLPDVAVIIGPNHRSYSPAVALTDHRAWRTPLGDVAVDAGITRSIADSFPAASVDAVAFYAEHSLEVQLPFLQYLTGLVKAEIKIVPVMIGSMAYAQAQEFVLGLGAAIGDALQDRNAVIIASTDFTHYETSESAAGKDSKAISKILALDEEGLLASVDLYDITMCGALP
ncbi:MAG TPA: AmmeMemoRadiSam system protein B, partial [Armatimonadota bacterium]